MPCVHGDAVKNNPEICRNTKQIQHCGRPVEAEHRKTQFERYVLFGGNLSPEIKGKEKAWCWGVLRDEKEGYDEDKEGVGRLGGMGSAKN